MTPKLSIAIPYHSMPHTDIFLARLLHSLAKQTFRDFEIILTKEGKMAETTNAAIKRCTGEIIKIMYMDDYFADEKALETMLQVFNGEWLIAGADNNPTPMWTDDIETGNNKLGSPSALMFKNDRPLLFDKKMSWLLDCDLYKRLYKRYGLPVILPGKYIGIGIHPDQMTNILTDKEKTDEFNYLKKKYA